MARQKQVDKPAPTQDPGPGPGPELGAEVETPWYQYTDWWEGLTAAEVDAKILEASRESGPGAWIVVPAGYPTRQERSFPVVNDDAPFYESMDAVVWAREFVRQFGGDEGLMIAWFSNAIMRGYDVAQERMRESVQKYIPSSDDLIEDVCRAPVQERAWTIYMELTRAKGYSPEHAKNAWKGARDFAAEGGNNGD